MFDSNFIEMCSWGSTDNLIIGSGNAFVAVRRRTLTVASGDIVHWRILHHQTSMSQLNQPTHNDNEVPLECATIPEIYQDALAFPW